MCSTHGLTGIVGEHLPEHRSFPPSLARQMEDMTDSLTPHSQTAVRRLRAVMLACGLIETLAALAVVLPRHFMSMAYSVLRLGEMPDAALFGYLARSTSLLWAVHGVLVLGLARDIRRYLPIIHLLGWLTLLMGVALVGIDGYEGVPVWWTCSEGPIVLAMGTIYVTLARQVHRSQ